MKVPIVKGVDRDTNKEVTGFYFEYPETTYCFSEDYEKFPVKMVSCIMSHRMMDWGLPNQPTITSPVEKDSLKIIGYREVGGEHLRIPDHQVTEVDRILVNTLIDKLIYIKDKFKGEMSLSDAETINEACNLLEHNTLIER